MGFDTFFQAVLQNQVVTGLSFTALLGGAVYQLRNIPHLIRKGVMRFFTVELTVLSTDMPFDWLDRWLSQHPYTQKSKMMRLRGIERAVSNEAEWALAPGPGTHVFMWCRRPIILERSFLSKDAAEGHRVSKPIEQLHFRTIGRSQAAIRCLIEEARQLSTQDELVTVRVWNEYEWTYVRGKAQRPLDTIILKAGQKERILADLQWFLASRDWYHQRGIPYRRGYCFSGKTGTGKTSIVVALAGHLRRPICVLNIGSIEGDNQLFGAFRDAPTDALILIEDIDCAYPAHSRETASGEAAEPRSRVTKAGLLNALDGITTPDGRIFVMTTNYPERLDSALVRPGRADVHEKFEYFGTDEQITMAARFFERFEPLPFPVSPAEMQATFMQYPHDAEAARMHLLNKVEILDRAA